MEHSQNQIVNSALWAAYADALGFMSELTDLTGLRKRVHKDKVSSAVEWQRVVGGRYGAYAKLPAGCYSDDTQLRLSTSRAIRGTGYFDVESFAKIELPVWLSYSLGAGSGTKAAAANLSTASVTWFSNFYEGREGRDTSYVRSGGNGAAMRVQPHVWAAKQRKDPRSYLPDVLRNSVCTHGNLRGIIGAVFHASILAKTLVTGEVPCPNAWRETIDNARSILDSVQNDRELSSFWLPIWEQRSRTTLQAELDRVVQECLHDIALLEEQTITDEIAYRSRVELVGGLDPKFRGSGTKTALLATALSWGYRGRSPGDALTTAANLLGSDTDTIATMAGAILGAIAKDCPDGPLLDQDYIEKEAARLYQISIGKDPASFCYPELMRWSPPKNQTSAVGRDGDQVVVAGLGPATPEGEVFRGQGPERSVWRWLRLDFGQTILAKMRAELVELPRRAVLTAPDLGKPPKHTQGKQSSHFAFGGDPMSTIQQSPVNRTLNDMTAEAIRSGFDPATIGKHIIDLSSADDGIERCIAYVAIVSKARKARLART